MSDKSSAALSVAVLKVLFDRLARHDRDLRDDLTTSTVPGERLPAVIPGTDTPVGWVTRTKPTKTKPAPKVTDPAGFLRWVEEHRPDEIVTPAPQVRSSFVAAVLADGGVTDTATGELVLPDGVEWVTPEPSKSTLRVVLEDGGAEAIEAAWAAGTLDLPALPSAS